MADDLVVKLHLKGDASGMTAAVKLTKSELEGLRGQLENTGAAEHSAAAGAERLSGGLERVGGSAGRLAARLLAGVGVAKLAAEFVQANREGQRLNASLKVATGSYAEAAKVTADLTRFSNRLGLALDDSVNAFLRLKNLGLDPSKAAIESYGNTAAAMGKGLDQMIEAVADAATGEFERLKEFGIKAKAEGDRVKFTFQGVTKSVRNDSASIQQYLLDLGNTQFAGALEEQAGTLDGAFSRLGNAISGLARQIGESGVNDALVALIDGTTKLVTVVSGAPPSIEALAAQLERLERVGLRGRNAAGGGAKAAIDRVKDEIQAALEALPGADGVRAEISRMDDEITRLSAAREALNRKINQFTGDRTLSRGSGRNKRATDYGRLVQEQQRVNAELTRLTQERGQLFDRLAEKEFTAEPFEKVAGGIKAATKETKALNKAQESLQQYLKKVRDEFSSLKPLKQDDADVSPTTKRLNELNKSLEARDLVGRAYNSLRQQRAGDAIDFAREAKTIIEELQSGGSSIADDLIAELQKIEKKSGEVIQDMALPGISFDTEGTQAEIEALVADLNKAFAATEANIKVGVEKSGEPDAVVAEIKRAVEGADIKVPVGVEKSGSTDTVVAKIKRAVEGADIKVPVGVEKSGEPDAVVAEIKRAVEEAKIEVPVAVSTGDVKSQLKALETEVSGVLKNISLSDLKFDEAKSKANAEALKKSIETSMAQSPIKIPVELDVKTNNRTGGQVTDELLAAALRGGAF